MDSKHDYSADKQLTLKLAAAEDVKPELACQICNSKRALVFCTQCDARFCSSCDRKLHVGALSKHKLVPFGDTGTQSKVETCEIHHQDATEYCEFCRKSVCPMCAKGPEHRDHYAGSAEAKDVIARHRRNLSEQLFLLKHKVGSGVGFLKHKLTKDLDSALSQLEQGRLKDDFDILRDCLEKKQKRMAEELRQKKSDFIPAIARAVRAIEEEFQKDAELIARGDAALTQSDAYMLESYEVTRLQHDMNRAIRKDTLGAIRKLEAEMNFKHHCVHRLDGVKRAVERLYIAGSDTGVDDMQDEDKQSTVTLDFHALDLGAVHRVMFAAALEKWNKRFPQEEYTDEEQQVKLLMTMLCRQLIEDQPLMDDILRKLFSRYPNQYAARQLQNDVRDALDNEFGSLASDEELVLSDLKERLLGSHNDRRIMNTELCLVWAGYIEKHIEKAVLEMIHSEALKKASNILQAVSFASESEGEED